MARSFQAAIVGDLAGPETLGRVFAGVDRVFVPAPPVPELAALEAHAFGAGTIEGAV